MDLPLRGWDKQPVIQKVFSASSDPAGVFALRHGSGYVGITRFPGQQFLQVFLSKIYFLDLQMRFICSLLVIPLLSILHHTQYLKVYSLWGWKLNFLQFLQVFPDPKCYPDPKSLNSLKAQRKGHNFPLLFPKLGGREETHVIGNSSKLSTQCRSKKYKRTMSVLSKQICSKF